MRALPRWRRGRRLANQIMQVALVESPGQALKDTRKFAVSRRSFDIRLHNDVLSRAAMGLLSVDDHASAVLISGLLNENSGQDMVFAKRWLRRADLGAVDAVIDRLKSHMLEFNGFVQDGVAAMLVAQGHATDTVVRLLGPRTLWALANAPEETLGELAENLTCWSLGNLQPGKRRELKAAWRHAQTSAAAFEVARRVGADLWLDWVQRQPGFVDLWAYATKNNRALVSIQEAAVLLAGRPRALGQFASAVRYDESMATHLIDCDPTLVAKLAETLGGDAEIARKLAVGFPGSLLELAEVTKSLALPVR